MKNKKFSKVILFLSVAIFYAFGFYHLTKFVTADEHYWAYERIPQYWNAISDHKWKKMLISDKPGITLAFTSGAALLLEKDPNSHQIENYDNLAYFNTNQTEKLYLYFRLPILILNGLLIILAYWLIKKVMENEWIALWSAMLMALSPVLIGISQIINPDSLLWSFGLLAIFSYLALLKYGQKKYLAMAAVFMGLSILTKYAALILFPFFLLLLFFFLNTNFLSSCEITSEKFKKKQLINYFLVFLFSAIVVIIFLPRMTIKPGQLYEIMFGFSKTMRLAIWMSLGGAFFLGLDFFLLKSRVSEQLKKILKKLKGSSKILFPIMLITALILFIGRNICPGQNWKLFQKIPFDLQYLFSAPSRAYGLKLWEALLLQFNSLFFSLTPVVLFFLLFLWLKYSLGAKSKYYYYAWLFTAFVLLYEISLVLLKVLAIIRYNIILYPIVALLSAIGVWEASLIIERKIKKIPVKPVITTILLVFSFSSLWMIKPFYLNYANFLLPKKNLIADSWGYGGYEAAQYLNSLPNAEKLVIWADYRGVCEFSVGKCITKYAFDQEKYKIDYYVFTRRGMLRYYSGKWYENENDDKVKTNGYYFQNNPVWSLFIDNRPDNYIKIIKAPQ